MRTFYGRTCAMCDKATEQPEWTKRTFRVEQARNANAKPSDATTPLCSEVCFNKYRGAEWLNREAVVERPMPEWLQREADLIRALTDYKDGKTATLTISRDDADTLLSCYEDYIASRYDE